MLGNFWSDIWSKFQFGLDIVTPLVFLGALWKWISIKNQERVAAVKEQRSRLAKVGAFDALTKIIDQTANLYSGGVATACIGLENTLDQHLVRRVDDFSIQENSIDYSDGICESWYARIDSEKFKELTQDSNEYAKPMFDFYINYEETSGGVESICRCIDEEMDVLADAAIENLRNFFCVVQAYKYTINPLLRMIYVENSDVIASNFSRSLELIEMLEKKIESIWMNTENAEKLLVTFRKLRASPYTGGPQKYQGDGAANTNYNKLINTLGTLLWSVQRARRSCKELCIFYSALLEHITLERDSKLFEECWDVYQGKLFKLGRTIR